MKKYILDLGANDGCSVRRFYSLLEDFDEYEVHSFEPGSIATSQNMLETVARFPNLTLHQRPVSDCEASLEFHEHSLYSAASTTWLPKAHDTNRTGSCGSDIGGDVMERTLTSVDIAAFIKDTISLEDDPFIILKMDIEGEEYRVIPHLLNQGLFAYVDRFYLEWHPEWNTSAFSEDELEQSIKKQNPAILIDRGWNALEDLNATPSRIKQDKQEKQELFAAITHLLACPSCSNDLEYIDGSYRCTGCNVVYPVVDNVPRFVPRNFYESDTDNSSIASKTKNYFGFEWDYFNDWGFIPDESVEEEDKVKYSGGLVSQRKSAFDSKCRLDLADLAKGKVILDAGCGNGRYTFEAATRGEALVIGVDIGYGSVKSSFKNTRSLDNAVILQANLHQLPFKNGVLNGAFSNGVLMHTGDAAKAFSEVSRTLTSGSPFVAHVYQRLNEHWEWNDQVLREFTTNLSTSDAMEFSGLMAQLGAFVSRFPEGFEKFNAVLRLQPTAIHMFDWYSAPTASHHTYAELATWFRKNGFKLLDSLPPKPNKPTGSWACNLKGIKK